MEEKLKIIYAKAFGYESPDVVHTELAKAEYFLSCNISETSCCSAIEAQLYSCMYIQ